MKHSAQLFAFFFQRLCTLIINKVSPPTDFNERDTFEYRASCNSVESSSVCFGISPCAFRNIENNRCRRSPELRGQTKQFSLRKWLGGFIYPIDKIKGFLVNGKLFKIHNVTEYKPFLFGKASFFTSHSSLLTSHCWRS